MRVCVVKCTYTRLTCKSHLFDLISYFNLLNFQMFLLSQMAVRWNLQVGIIVDQTVRMKPAVLVMDVAGTTQIQMPCFASRVHLVV